MRAKKSKARKSGDAQRKAEPQKAEPRKAKQSRARREEASAERARGAVSSKAALSDAQDRRKSVRVRAAGLEKLAGAVCAEDKTFNAVLAILQDPDEPPELRSTALRTLQAASFSVVAFNPRRAEYLATLREMSSDAEPELRQSVLGILVRERDGYAQQLLLEGLQDPKAALVSPEKALQLLSYDVHTEAYPMARKIARKPPTPEAKREALRLLGADAGSVALFESVLRNKNEPAEFRRLSAAALQALKPAALQTHAREIVLDDDEDEEVKAASLTALSLFGAADEMGRDDELRAKTTDLKSSGSPELKRGAKAFLARYHRV
ncbi:MAG TPA: hypothetical protein VFQ61_36380 [Polyangiaceae bacterium]|nr:hypothetical protein [Polyangiaceae bacterium]